MDPTIARVRDLLDQAPAIAALTGAGISAESGIPTFRGPGGLWRTYRAENLATPEAFARDPKLVWEWYNFRRRVIAGVEPNAGHRALAELERRKENFSLITQNVDGLHDRAGSRNLFKIHGDIWTLRCTVCAHERSETATPLPEVPPYCACGGMERPGVVWFGEGLPEQIWISAQRAVHQAQMLLVIGTSAVVYPAAGLAALAKRSGAVVVEINIAETPVSAQADYSLRGPAAEILPELLKPQNAVEVRR
jgi:NAD-dependent protein deacetylase/lipoamidase